MSYINISKPTDASYSNVNSSGKESFDDINVTFDQVSTFFDGLSLLSWTNIARPGQSLGLNVGMTMGLLIPLTSSSSTRSNDPWTRIVKPT